MNAGDGIGCGVCAGGREEQVLKDLKAREASVRSVVTGQEWMSVCGSAVWDGWGKVAGRV